MENKDICTFPDCGQSIDNVTLVGFGPGNTPQSVPVSRLAKAGDDVPLNTIDLTTASCVSSSDDELTVTIASAGGKHHVLANVGASVTGISVVANCVACTIQFTLPSGTAFDSFSVGDGTDEYTIDGLDDIEWNDGSTYQIGILNGYGYIKEFPAPVIRGSVTIGGKIYQTVVINGKEWMAENLDYNIGAGSGSANPSLGFRYYDVNTETNYDETYVAGLKFGKYYGAMVPFWWDVYKRGSAALKSEIPTNYKNFFDAIPAGWRLPTAADFTSLGIPNSDDEESVALDPTLCLNQTECKWGVNFQPTNTKKLSLVPSSAMSLDTIGSQEIHEVWNNSKKNTLDEENSAIFNLQLMGELKIHDIEQIGTQGYNITADYYINAYFAADDYLNTTTQEFYDNCYVEESGEWVKPTGQDFLNWLEMADFNNIRLVRDV